MFKVLKQLSMSIFSLILLDIEEFSTAYIFSQANDYNQNRNYSLKEHLTKEKHNS